MNYRPLENEYAEFYNRYISRVPEQDILKVLESQIDILRKTAAKVPAERELYRYEPEKWSIRQVFGHINDAERVFGFRAFCISRKEQQSLPGFEQNDYVANAPYEHCDLNGLVTEFEQLRSSNLYSLRCLDKERWTQIGKASNYDVSVRALVYIMAGHVRHHLAVLDSLYQTKI